MAFGSSVAAYYSTGTYAVKRYGAGTTTDGHYTPAAPSTFTFDGSVQPISGRALRDLREGLRADDVRVIYTKTELRTTMPGNDQPDVVTINGEDFRVIKVEAFFVISDHYRVTLERLAVP